VTTFADDFVKLNFVSGARTIPCSALGLEWPPPERISTLNGVEIDPMVRTTMSAITDEQRERMTNVARGANYVYEEEEA